VILLEMRQAKFWLDKAMRMCPQGAWQQRRCVRFWTLLRKLDDLASPIEMGC
jgi:hypothetical protein